MTGFLIDEKMCGYHYFINDPRGTKRHMEFNVTWGTNDIKKWLTPRPDCFMVSSLDGTVTIEGLCKEALIRGSLVLDYFGRGTITYSFKFRVNGILYTYEGVKVNIKPWNLLTSHTTCVGTISDKDGIVSRSVTFFKLKNAFNFLKSFRLT